jgi:DNA-binding CsgD family transcriptional regulator
VVVNHGSRARARERLERFVDAKLDLPALFAETTPVLRRALPYDSGCWHTMDPTALIETGCLLEDMPQPTPQVAQFAYRADDYNSFAGLTRSARHSGVLSEATGGHLDRSLRYRELLSTVNMVGELRVSFVVDGAAWGCVSFFREAAADFTADERDFAHDVAGLLGRGFRTAAAHTTKTGDLEARGPGLLLLDEHRRVVSRTAPARQWLAELGAAEDHQVPFTVLSVAERVRSTGEDATVRVLGGSGQWVHVHAAPASGDEPRVAIIMQAAPSPTIAPLISATYELSARERELTELVLDGCGTGEIAERLYISPHTVQGHLKSIFMKTGVRSRRELVARIFAGHDRRPLL